MKRNYIIGLIIVLIPLPTILSYLNSDDLIDQKLAVTLVIVEVPIGLLFHFISKKHENRNESKYIPNQENYFKHVKNIYNAINVERKRSGYSKGYFEIITNSPKKREILQHLATYFTYKQANVGNFFDSYMMSHVANKHFETTPELRNEFIKSFNNDFQHMFQIMEDSTPLVGLCDGCKMDYLGEDKERCLGTLNNFNHEYEKGFVKQFFED
jgi:hypothetical protein